jgi:hypothetical protein
MIAVFDPCTAMCLSILGAGLEAFDVSHLQAQWRDLLLSRFNYLLYAILGADARSCAELLRCRGNKNRVRGVLSPWIQRVRCLLDGAKIMQLQLGELNSSIVSRVINIRILIHISLFPRLLFLLSSCRCDWHWSRASKR